MSNVSRSRTLSTPNSRPLFGLLSFVDPFRWVLIDMCRNSDILEQTNAEKPAKKSAFAGLASCSRNWFLTIADMRCGVMLAETSSWTNGRTLKDPVFGSGKLDWSGIDFSWWFYFQFTTRPQGRCGWLIMLVMLVNWCVYLLVILNLLLGCMVFLDGFFSLCAFVGRWVLPPWVAVSRRWAYIGPAYLFLGVFVRGWNGWNPYRVGAPSQSFLPMEWHGA